MFIVSALLLDDALLKYVVVEVVLFSVVAFKAITFHKVSVATHLGSLVTELLQIFEKKVQKSFSS